MVVAAVVLEVDDSEYTHLKRSMIRISKEDTDGLTHHGCLLRSSAVTRVTMFARHCLSLEWRKRSVSTTAFNFMFPTPTVLTVVLSVIMEVLKVEQWSIYLANCLTCSYLHCYTVSGF